MNTQRPRASRLQFSLRAVLLVLTLAAIGGWWWQKRFRVESTIRQPQGVGRGVHVVELQRTESRRRQGLGNTVRDGPTTVVNEQGVLISEEEWKQGRRHGIYRRWRDDGELLVECEFIRDKLVRVGNLPVTDFLNFSDVSDSETGPRILQALYADANFDYLDQPLNDVIDDVSFTFNVPMLIDTAALDERGVSWKAPITLEIRRVPLFVALVELLAPLELACVYRHEVLWIATPDSTLFDDEKAARVVSEGHSAHLEWALASVTSCDYLSQPLNDVLKDIAFNHNIKIEPQLANPSEPVNLHLRRGSLRSALSILSHIYKLHCVARDDKLVIIEREGKNPMLRVEFADPPPQEAASPETLNTTSGPFSKDALSEDPFSGR